MINLPKSVLDRLRIHFARKLIPDDEEVQLAFDSLNSVCVAPEPEVQLYFACRWLIENRVNDKISAETPQERLDLLKLCEQDLVMPVVMSQNYFKYTGPAMAVITDEGMQLITLFTI